LDADKLYISIRKYLGTAEPVLIGNDVWIGRNVTILLSIKTGNNVVVVAKAVVNKDDPGNCVVGGLPAILTKEIENNIEKIEIKWRD
jgi:acetyltransferase-like isoleucine patch superfamily enzyme